MTNPLNAPYGDIFKGVKAYFDMVNSKGGIYGRKLELVSERDDQMTQNQQRGPGLLTQDNVFAAVGLATIFDFSGADELAKNGIPTLRLEHQRRLEQARTCSATSGALCLGCSGVDLPWMAKQLDKKKIGVLAYNVDDSKKCAEGRQEVVRGLPDRQGRASTPTACRSATPTSASRSSR